MTDETEITPFEQFCRRNGLPHDNTGTVDMSESIQRWIAHCERQPVEDPGAPVADTPGVK